jgi:hypothetical protein
MTAKRQAFRPWETVIVDISRIKRLLGLGDDKPEDLEVAMEKQILPEARPEETERASGVPRPDRDRQALSLSGQLEQACAWCNKTCQLNQDGFHLTHVAFGTTQERHSFCSDDCYEAFRRMYPARVHRNCYETPCAGCTFCIKRYADESDAFPLSGQDGGTTEKG